VNRVAQPDRAAVVFFADGMAQPSLHRALRAGLLPNIERLFVRGGVEIRNTIVAIPSLTYANTCSLLTGLLPGHHGILGNRWFDPRGRQMRDYGHPLRYRDANDDLRPRTIFEHLASEFTINVQCHTRRGASVTIDQDISSGLLWGLGRYRDVDRRVGVVVPRVLRSIRRAGRWPMLWLNYFPGLDEIGHRCGPQSREYLADLRTIDEQIGRIADAALDARAGRATLLALVTDHGMVPVDGRIPVSGALAGLGRMQTRGLHTAAFDVARLDRHLRDCGGVAWADTDRSLRVHILPAGAPRERRDEIVERLRCFAGERLLIATSEGRHRVRVHTPHGEFVVERRRGEGRREYRVIGAASEAERLGGEGWASSREWLAASATRGLPDFVPQIVEVFDSRRSGDVLAFCEGSHSFGMRFRAGHGSVTPDDMRVSHYFAGDGLPRGAVLPSARLVDFTPTVLDWLGRWPLSQPLDGVSGLPELATAN
jgi:Type I phosphodiesterase / nucleotide pyrophosphatase